MPPVIQFRSSGLLIPRKDFLNRGGQTFQSLLVSNGVEPALAAPISKSLQDIFGRYSVEMRTILEIIERGLSGGSSDVGALFTSNYDTLISDLPTRSGIYPVTFDGEIYGAECHLDTAGTATSQFAVDKNDTEIFFFQMASSDAYQEFDYTSAPYAVAHGDALQVRWETAGAAAKGPSIILKIRPT